MIFQEQLIKSFLANAGKPAFEADGTTLTYAQLRERADAVTAYLLGKGLRGQEVIGVYVEDRMELIIAMIGIMNAGCVFVPLDTSLPHRRLSMVLRDLNPGCILSGTGSAIAGLPIPVVSLPSLAALQKDQPGPVYPEYSGDDSLYIYYTSGSTGTPKGIVGRNASLEQFIRWEIDTFSIGGGDRVSQLTSPYFDAFLRDVFVPLLSGATLCIPPAGKEFFTAAVVSKWIDTQRITLIHCVPTLFRVIRAELPSGDVFASLRLILLSGERIIPSELKDWYDRFGSRIRLVNFYGPTETTMIRFYYPLQRSDVSLQRIPVGQPIADTSFLIAQNGFTPCQLLVPGELYILSDYGTKGYLNAPDLTAEKFLTIEDGDRGPRPAFRTGDTAKLLSDGKVDLLGRKDRQVKIRGVRIEPDEIENVLIESGLVENAVAVRQDGDNGNDRLIVFFVEKEGLAGDASSRVQACLEERLPSYMVPSAFIPVAAFPLLSNGKIDYRTLSTMEPAGNLVAPANDIEERLLYLWKEILGNKPISTDDNFASLGGNSLSIMRLIARIYKDIHVRITLADIFSNLTIQKQAVLIGKAGRDNLYVIPRAGSKPSYPLSLAQERMYFNYELNPRSTAYNMPLAWEITGSADAAGPRIPDGITSDRLKAAFIALIDRHVSLRTAFRFIDGSLRQVITDGFDVILEEKEVDSISPDEAVAGFVRPFDLGEAPLIRAGLLTLSTGRRILAVDVHHICCDGISQMILLEDFLRSYEGAQLKPLAIQYSDYAEWESDFRKTEEYRTHREFWLQRFEGELPRIEWPGEGPGGEPGGGVGSVNEGANIRWTPDPAIVDTITHRWAEWDITTFSGLFAVYLLFLSRYTGQDDLVIGINTSGRLQEELEGVTGMFAKTLPIRYRIDPSLSVKTFVQQVHRHLAEAVSRQIYDLADIVGDLNASRKTPVQDLFDTVFVFQNFGVGGGSQIFSKLTLKKRTAKYPLTFFVTESAGGIHFEAEYARHRWTAESIQHMADQYGKFLSLFSENMDGVVGDCLGGDTIAEAVTEESIVFKF